VSGSELGGCALRADGSLSCWGFASGPDNPPIPLALFTDSYREVRVGLDATCVLSTSNKVDCAIGGQSRLLRLDGEYAHLSSSEAVCAVRPDGPPTCVGSVAETPSLTFNEVMVGEYTYPRCGVLIDGRLVCWPIGPGPAFQ
jgi:hypothetical protein